MRAVAAAIFFGNPHDHGAYNFTLLCVAAGRRILDRSHDNVANSPELDPRTTEHANTHDLFRAGVIGNFEACLRLDHACTSSLSASDRSDGSNSSSSISAPSVCPMISTTRQRLSLLSGRVSSIRTVSPIWQRFSSSCA